MLSAGKQLGPYEIVSLLGAGGMGEVYRAAHSKIGRVAAVKVLTQATQSPDFVTALVEDRAPRVSGEEGLWTNQLMEWAYREAGREGGLRL